jgi:phosphoribosylanthranilate isomerase
VFKIKICGITSVTDARMVLNAGADAIGLNFYRQSPRFVSCDVAAEIAKAVNEQLVIVGVFVNHSVVEIAHTVADVGLDFCQLHGDERPELMRDLPPNTKIIRAVRVDCTALDDCRSEVRSWRDFGASAILVDPKVNNQYGGTGRQFDWGIVRELNIRAPLILAGGLNRDNVSHAIEVVRPTAVDVASGVELALGIKDPVLLAGFVEQARSALDRLKSVANQGER